LITRPDLLFIIDSLTVADAQFLIEDSQDEKRERRSKKERERNKFIGKGEGDRSGAVSKHKPAFQHDNPFSSFSEMDVHNDEIEVRKAGLQNLVGSLPPGDEQWNALNMGQ
jgi:hypothetical protein